MSLEYWNIAAESLLDECGISATAEQLGQLGKRLKDAAEMEGECTGNPSYRVDPVKQSNPYEERCNKLQIALDRLAHRFGVSVDPDRMEISYHGHVGGTLYATTRENI